MARLDLTRPQILAFRRRVGALDERLPPGSASLRQAAWAGLTDSMPRAALLSIHARVEGTKPDTWEDPSLVQLWGPRFSAYAVPEVDRAVFTLGRLRDDDPGRQFAEQVADELESVLAGRRLDARVPGRVLGVNPNRFRYAATTGRVLIRWDGARQPTIWMVPRPTLDPLDARLELARRYLHVFGPGTPAGFGDWAGIRQPRAHRIFQALAGSLVAVRTPIGDAWILPEDEAGFRSPPTNSNGARFLPAGDTYYLLQGADRELVVPEANLRSELWTSRVWPGALLVDGEIVGTWRRANAKVSVRSWRRLSPVERRAAEAEAASLPLPGILGAISVTWEP
jgi:hypothetical protein